MQNKKKLFLAEICCKFLAFFWVFAAKMLKMTISTSVWSAQHPNAGRNIQQLKSNVQQMNVNFKVQSICLSGCK